MIYTVCGSRYVWGVNLGGQRKFPCGYQVRIRTRDWKATGVRFTSSAVITPLLTNSWTGTNSQIDATSYSIHAQIVGTRLRNVSVSPASSISRSTNHNSPAKIVYLVLHYSYYCRLTAALSWSSRRHQVAHGVGPSQNEDHHNKVFGPHLCAWIRSADLIFCTATYSSIWGMPCRACLIFERGEAGGTQKGTKNTRKDNNMYSL